MASGDTLLEFHPLQGEPPSSDFASVDTRNNHLILDFDPDTTESIVYKAIMPRNYGGGGLTVYIHYAMSTATSGNVDWEVAIERVGDQQQDIDTDSFATAQTTIDTTVPGTSGFVDIITVTLTNSQIDGLLVGESFRMKVSAPSAGTAAGDIELYAIEIKET